MPERFPPWRRRLSATLAACLALSAAPAPVLAQVRLPSLGETASQDLSVGAERRLGEQIMREARRDPEYLDDPVLLEYLQSVWDPLVAASRQLGNIDADTDHAFAWEPFLVRDRSVNAFALPGGFVGVHLGLIALTNTTDQLASVLAHEMSHVTQRHIARSIAPQEHASMLAIATMLLGIIAASRANNVDVANAAIMGGQGAAIQSQLNYSRDVEREADRIGFGVLAQSGYAPSAMAAMFDQMEASTRINDNGGFPYLRTHPLTTERISEARNRTLLTHGAPARVTLQHAMMQARARVLMAPGAQSLQRWTGESSSPQPADRVAALYAGALAASLLKDSARAEALAAQALQLARSTSPSEPRAVRDVRLLQAELQLARADPQGALQALQDLPLGATERPPMLLRAQAALDLQRRDAGAATQPLRDSTEELQTWLAERPHDGLGWERLAATSQALGLKLRALRAGAEVSAAQGDLGGAVDRLRAAQAAARSATGQDFIEASVIDARLRQLMAQRRQIALEARGENRKPGPGDEPPPQ